MEITTPYRVNADTLRPILNAQVNAATHIMTDEGAAAKKISSEYQRHDMVNHGIGEYVQGGAHQHHWKLFLYI